MPSSTNRSKDLSPSSHPSSRRGRRADSAQRSRDAPDDSCSFTVHLRKEQQGAAKRRPGPQGQVEPTSRRSRTREAQAPGNSLARQAVFKTAMFQHLLNVTISGGYGGEVPPDPISNSVVKLPCADGTWRETAWESRSSPESFSRTLGSPCANRGFRVFGRARGAWCVGRVGGAPCLRAHVPRVGRDGGSPRRAVAVQARANDLRKRRPSTQPWQCEVRSCSALACTKSVMHSCSVTSISRGSQSKRSCRCGLATATPGPACQGGGEAGLGSEMAIVAVRAGSRGSKPTPPAPSP